jgi:glycosyltransferase involved in cell wall biosynthesis
MQSSVLVLARPDNIQSKGGFPTKLGEYLATGRPVLITSVGDIPKYLSHGINGFLTKPGSAQAFAEQMTWILNNYAAAKNAGLEGKKLTMVDFDNVYQAKRVIEFVATLKN